MTNDARSADPAYLEKMLSNTALGQLGQREDVANVVHALASPAFRFVTGQVIEVSDGFAM